MKVFPDREVIAKSIKDEVKKCKQFRASLKAPSTSVKTDLSDQLLKIRDDIDLCMCKTESILTNFPVQALSSVEDIRLNVSKVAENIATYKHLISKLLLKEVSAESTTEAIVHRIVHQRSLRRLKLCSAIYVTSLIIFVRKIVLLD